MSKYAAVEYLYSIDDAMVAMLLSSAIAQLQRLDDATPLEKKALDCAIKAQFQLEFGKK